MDKDRNKELVALAIEFMGGYLLAHPHAIENGKRAFYFYAARICQSVAFTVGDWGIKARVRYDRCNLT